MRHALFASSEHKLRSDLKSLREQVMGPDSHGQFDAPWGGQWRGGYGSEAARWYSAGRNNIADGDAEAVNHHIKSLRSFHTEDADRAAKDLERRSQALAQFGTSRSGPLAEIDVDEDELPLVIQFPDDDHLNLFLDPEDPQIAPYKLAKDIGIPLNHLDAVAHAYRRYVIDRAAASHSTMPYAAPNVYDLLASEKARHRAR